MDEIETLHKKKVRELEAIMKNNLLHLNVLSPQLDGLTDLYPSLANFNDIVNCGTQISALKIKIIDCKRDHLYEYLSIVAPILTNKEFGKGGITARDYYNCMGLDYISIQPESVLCALCSSDNVLSTKNNIYHCRICRINFEHFDTYTISKVDKVIKYKRLDYFIEIIKKLQKTHNFTISELDMEIIIQFFKEVEMTWHKLYRSKSFISYPYLFRKCLELLATYEAVLKVWKLEKSDMNIKKNDKKWKPICDYLRYEYIPTI